MRDCSFELTKVLSLCSKSFDRVWKRHKHWSCSKNRHQNIFKPLSRYKEAPAALHSPGQTHMHSLTHRLVSCHPPCSSEGLFLVARCRKCRYSEYSLCLMCWWGHVINEQKKDASAVTAGPASGCSTNALDGSNIAPKTSHAPLPFTERSTCVWCMRLCLKIIAPCDT